MKVEELDRLMELGRAAGAFASCYDSLCHKRWWYEKERNGIVPEMFAKELQESEARLKSALEALK